MIRFSTFLKGLRLKRIEFLRRVGGQLADYENGSGSAIWTNKWDRKDINRSIHLNEFEENEKETYAFVSLSAQVCRYWSVL